MTQARASGRHQRGGASVLVTGASGGLGLATALRLAEKGFRVWASIRDPHLAPVVAEAAFRRGVDLDLLMLDVTDPASIDEGVERLLREGGSLYGVVHNAGSIVRGYFEDLSDEEFRGVVEVNLFGAVNLTRRILPHLRQEGRGRIVVVSSVAGRVGSMALTAYAASKFALEGFSESLSLEVAPLGIQVSLVEPGIVATGLWHSGRAAARAADPQGPYYEWFRRVEDQVQALARTSKTTPEDVADTVWRALTDRRPRLRYVVGTRASLVVSLRRHVPGELFDRLYFGEVMRRVVGTRP